jgi:hypothetical protein
MESNYKQFCALLMIGSFASFGVGWNVRQEDVPTFKAPGLVGGSAVSLNSIYTSSSGKFTN